MKKAMQIYGATHVYKLLASRRVVFLNNLNLKKICNAIKLIWAFLRKETIVNAYPVFIKVDVTPLCQLCCPVCIHNKSESLRPQDFNVSMKMDFELFKKLVDEISDKTMALSLYHMGEPLQNKAIFDMCAYASSRKINTYFTTNFNFNLSDKDLERLATCGVSMVVVAMDGFSQETYERNRVGGSFDLVKNNLERFLSIRESLNQRFPFIKVQSLLFEYNLHEKELVRGFCNKIGVNQVEFLQGGEGLWIISNAPKYLPRGGKVFPLCKWLYFASVVLYDGDVVPCCKFRLDESYAKGIPRLKMGNLKGQKFIDIFNSTEYQISRKLASTPVSKRDNQNIINNFCYSCKFLYSDHNE